MHCTYVVYLETTNKFLYRPGKTYQYEFESDVTTSIAGTSSEKSTLHLRALAQLETVSTCEMILRVSTDTTLQFSGVSSQRNTRNELTK